MVKALRTGALARYAEPLRTDVQSVAATPVSGVSGDGLAENDAMNADNSMSDEIVKAKIRRALLSGPDVITRDATVAEMAHLHVCGSPWDGNEYHPGDRGVWTIAYARPR
jgi:hypothetical protein